MVEIDQSQWYVINDLVYKIYEALDLNNMRKIFLELLNELVPYDKAIFDFGRKKKSGIVFFDPVTINFEEEHLKEYFNYYQHLDYISWIYTQKTAIVYKETDYIDKRIREETEIFKNWMLPMNCYYTAGASIMNKGTFFGSVTLFRQKSSGDFTEIELEILDVLNHHLSSKLYQNYPNGIKENRAKQNDYQSKYNFTDREVEIIEQVLEGLNNQEVSQRLYISENTVKKHLSNIYKKLEVKTRTQLVKLFMEP